jgi:hypothetical protein
MKAVVVLASAIALLLTVPARTQEIRQEEAQDKVFGWMKIYDFKAATAPLTVDHRVYSIAQLSLANNFANWIQQSYVPVGGLGDVTRFVSAKLTAGNQETASLPQSYGAIAKIYTSLKYGAARKVEPLSTDHILWKVSANEVYGEPAISLNTPEQYYFTLPTFSEQGTNYGDELEKAVDLSAHPVLGRFPAYFFRNSRTGNQKYLLLSRDNRLPFVKVTRGEYLDALSVAIARKYEQDKFNIRDANQGKGNEARIASAMVDVDQRHAKRVAALAAAREKYKARLQEVAEIDSDSPDIALENRADAFLGTGGGRLRIPVYKVDPAVAALCKTGGPQWIIVTWTAQLNDPTIKKLHDAVINNFDFEYLYNYVFAPEKVKGQSYAPLRNPAATEPVPTTAASTSSKARAADPSVFFFDDFSTTPVGKAPIGWRSTLDNTGASSVVATIDGLEGRWATTTGHVLTLGQLKTPLPADFTVTYDLVAAANYTWGARGMTFSLSKGPASGGTGTFVSLKLRPGSGSGDGEAVLEARLPGPPGYLSGSKYFTVPGFSSKTQSTVAVMLVKQGERLQVFLNKVKVFESDKAIPTGFVFDQVSLQQGGTFDANSRMYISNVSILKK